jgi:hypothetical protein
MLCEGLDEGFYRVWSVALAAIPRLEIKLRGFYGLAGAVMCGLGAAFWGPMSGRRGRKKLPDYFQSEGISLDWGDVLLQGLLDQYPFGKDYAIPPEKNKHLVLHSGDYEVRRQFGILTELLKARKALFEAREGREDTGGEGEGSSVVSVSESSSDPPSADDAEETSEEEAPAQKKLKRSSAAPSSAPPPAPPARADDLDVDAVGKKIRGRP